MKLTVDGASCMGHGRCYQVAPDLLTFDDEGYVTIRDETIEVSADLLEAAEEAAGTCPEAAISRHSDPCGRERIRSSRPSVAEPTLGVYAFTTHHLMQLCAAMRSERQDALSESRVRTRRCVGGVGRSRSDGGLSVADPEGGG